jgi:hypothetical protein
MILNIDRGHILVRLFEKTAKVQGEMFFPGENKMGFVVYADTIDYWEPKEQLQKISQDDIARIIEDIRADFAKGGHILEIESA